MASSTLQLCAQLRLMIYYHLDNDHLHDALFFAGRMYALDRRNLDAIHLLSLCHLKSKQIKLAYDYSHAAARRALHLGCSYVFARACLRLNKNAEGIDVLERIRHAWDGKNDWVKPSDPTQRFIPDAPSVLCLLGKLYRAEFRTEKAIDCWVAALKLNPFMWEAFENLCDTGTHVKTVSVFKLHPELAAIVSARSGTAAHRPPSHDPTPHLTDQLVDPFGTAHDADPFSSAGGQTNHTAGAARPNGISGTDLSAMSRTGPVMEVPNAPSRRPRPGQPSTIEINADPAKPRSLSTRSRNMSVSDETDVAAAGPSQPHAAHKRTISGNTTQITTSNASSDLNNIRRSRRLFNQIRPNISKQPPSSSMPDDKDPADLKKARATGTKGRSTVPASTVGRVVSGNRKPMFQDQKGVVTREQRPESAAEHRKGAERNLSKQPEQTSNLESVKTLLQLLQKIGEGVYYLSQFDAQTALRCFLEIPQMQRDTPWVLARIARCYFEQNNHAEASRIFGKIRKMVPSSVTDMEIYSTVLWHEKHDTELAFLSHELLDIDRSSPEAWCTIGNAFSLRRDHDQALKCFKRSTQLDPKFAYGYTLQGHEHMANDKLDDALAAYRRAISVDSRHYNGWYGLGKVYEKLGEHDLAEKHYRAAASINPNHAVLYCCIGYVLEKRKQPQLALEQYDYASHLQPLASQALFRKSRLLLNLRRYNDAIRALNVLKDVAPTESNVYFMLGRAHARLRQKGQAVKHYTTAMNLDPKAAPYLKEQMEDLDAADEGEDYDDEDEDEEMT